MYALNLLYVLLTALLPSYLTVCSSLLKRDNNTMATFAVMALRSASPIHFGQVNANGNRFWIYKSTATWCPGEFGAEGINCSTYNNATAFIFFNERVNMDVAVSGGQMVYVAPTGELGYTHAFTADIPIGSTTTGFTYTSAGGSAVLGYFSTPVGLSACEQSDGTWKVYGAPPNPPLSNGTVCLGYTGFIGGATTLTSFHHSFNITPSTSAQITGNVVAALQAGCFFGSILMAFFTDKLGRKKGLMVAAGVMAVGSVMQTVAEGRLGLFYAGRVVSGVGVGAAITLYGFFIFLGIAIAYWVDYACTSLLPSTSPNQWRIPVALQILPAAGLLLGILFCRESPRWLIRKGRTEEALENLIYIRYYDHHQESSSGGGDGDGGGDADAGAETETREEFLEICESVRMEAEVRHGVGVREMWARGNRRRVALGFGVMVCQQLSGTVTFTYYAPQFFTEVGISSSSTGLFATGIYGIVKTVATMLFLLFVIDRVGRRPSLICGAVGMAITMLVVACVLATHPVSQSQSGDGDGKGGVSSASYAMIVMIYLFCVSYACSWGPVPWTYVGYVGFLFPSPPKSNLTTIVKSTRTASENTASLWRRQRNGRSTTVYRKSCPLPLRILGGESF
ncbi:MAG: hypothetical protein M1834_003253 [Cirrosporium novae-zelandiae]|nr:MAG: hypothetical protein M1834_003253 [Cirrosporium novae-zelandiae]